MINRIIQGISEGKYNLQLFSDEAAADEGNSDADKGADDDSADETGKDDDGEERRYSQAEVDEMIRKRLARERKSSEQAIKDAKAEAAKYAKMSEEERRKADEAAKQKEIDDLKAENARLQAEAMKSELGKSAAIDLEKKDIAATPDILEFVVGPDAEITKELTNKFIKAILADRKAQEVKRATKNTPKSYGYEPGSSDPFAKIMKKYGR